MPVVRQYVMALLTALAVALAYAQGPSSPIDDIPAKYRLGKPADGAVVARVNGFDIKTGDVDALLWEWRGFDVMQDLITYQLVRSEAEKLRVVVPDKDVESAMAAGIADMQKTLRPGQSVDMALLGQGFTRSRLFLRYRTEALLNAMAIRMYDPKQIAKVSTLVFRHTQEASSLSEAIGKAQAAYDRLKKGESWDAVLQSTTADPQILKTKGLLGWRELGAFPEPVQKEIKALKAGDVTKPAQTENGIQIFRLDVLGKDAKAADEQEMRAAFTNSAKQAILSRIRAEARIERLYPPVPGINSQKDGN